MEWGRRMRQWRWEIQRGRALAQRGVVFAPDMAWLGCAEAERARCWREIGILAWLRARAREAAQ